MKIKNKGKVYPSPTAASSSRSEDGDFLSVLKLLPAAILVLASVLSLEDREVLAYMITRSMKTATGPSSVAEDPRRRVSRRSFGGGSGGHRSPVFHCDCFDCYTSYWFRWDSSPNRELIHQAIEAFEDHLANGEQPRKNSRAKRRDRAARRPNGKRPDTAPASATPEPEEDSSEATTAAAPRPDGCQPVDGGLTPTVAPSGELPLSLPLPPSPTAAEEEEALALAVRNAAAMGTATTHKGLARKVLPDVLGLLNSRLWSLWNPNV